LENAGLHADDGLGALATAAGEAGVMPVLDSLVIGRNAEDYSGASLTALLRSDVLSARITALDLSHARLPNQNIKWFLEGLRLWPNLRVLQLNGIAYIHPPFGQVLAQPGAFPRLEVLGLRGGHEADIGQFAYSFRGEHVGANLIELNLSECPRGAFATMFEHLAPPNRVPNLSVLKLDHTNWAFGQPGIETLRPLLTAPRAVRVLHLRNLVTVEKPNTLGRAIAFMTKDAPALEELRIDGSQVDVAELVAVVREPGAFGVLRTLDLSERFRSVTRAGREEPFRALGLALADPACCPALVSLELRNMVTSQAVALPLVKLVLEGEALEEWSRQKFESDQSKSYTRVFRGRRAGMEGAGELALDISLSR
jgi:hypothetical protein